MALSVLLLSGLPVIAQNTTQGIMPDVPPSPQAVAFNRLGDYQVSNNYGAPDISIPLFEIDHHGYKIPLALHYEATPLKPGYNYDVTGVGWTLSGNSCVSRTIKDRADEVGRFSNPFTLDSFQEPSGQPKMYVNYAGDLDKLNFQYDSYNILLPSGRSIPFFMYKSGGVMTYDLMDYDSDVRIECSYGTNSIDSFRVWDENGVKYSFRVADKAANIFQDSPNAERNVTWLLTSVEIPAKGRIDYEYTSLQDIHSYMVEEPVLRVSRLMSQMQEDAQRKRFEVSSPPQPECPRYRMRFLSRISYGPTRVDFNYQADGKHMSEIVVTDCGDTIRKYTLAVNGSSTYGSSLTSLVISGQGNADRLAYGFMYWNTNPGDRTDYWGNRCNSNSAKDLGNFNMYFNNEEDGHMYLNRNELQSQLSIDNLAQLIENNEDDPYYYYKIKLQSTTNGDTRQPTSPEFHGVLRRITYPNGGYTDFTFENHRFPTATAADGDFVFDRHRQRIIEGGGFRIKSIVNYTADDSIASEDHYRYGFTLGDIIHRNFPLPLPDSLDIGNLAPGDTINHHIGCGEAVVDPNLLTFMTFSYYKPGSDYFNNYRQIQKMALGQDSEVRNMINIQGSATWWDAYFSANTFRALLGGRRPVVYPEITVYHGDPDRPAGCISKTVYKYDIYTVHHDGYTYYLMSFNPTATADTAYFEHTHYNMFSDAPGLMCEGYQAAKRHQLKYESEYSYNTNNSTWELVSEEAYSYNEERLPKSGYIFNSCISREYRSNYVGPLGNNQWLWNRSLSEFYKTVSQNIGRSTISEKSKTTLRRGGTRSRFNTVRESVEYLYPGVLRSRMYQDQLLSIYYYYNDYDKVDWYTYVSDLSAGSSTVIAGMKSRNMLASLVSVDTYSDGGDILSGSKIDYASYEGNFLPSILYERNGDTYEASVKVLSYGAYGNPMEIVDLKTGNVVTGTHTVFLWGSYSRYMTAMIKNATMSQVQGILSQLTGDSRSRYATLKASLPNAQVETWDYKPLVGVSSHTDASGNTILYEYDGLGRLKSEKRIVNGVSEPEILRQYEYNFMNTSFY